MFQLQAVPVVEHWTSSIPFLGSWREHEKAFDHVPCGVLWVLLQEYGVLDLLLGAVQSLYKQSECLVSESWTSSGMPFVIDSVHNNDTGADKGLRGSSLVVSEFHLCFLQMM